jgi:hypothetical protein
VTLLLHEQWTTKLFSSSNFVFFWFRDDLLKSDFCLPVYEIMQEYCRLNMHCFVRNLIIRFLLAYYESMKVNCGPVACTVS